MKLEQAESLFVEELFKASLEKKAIENCELLSVEKLTGDASARRYYKIFTNKRTYVVCLDNPTDEVSKNTFLAVQDVFEKSGVKVPHIYDHQVEKGYILQEYLGDCTLLQTLGGIKSLDEEFVTYKACIDQVVNIHSIDSSLYKNMDFSKLSFDKEKLMSEVQFTIDYFIGDYLNYKLNDVELDKLYSSFVEICNKIASIDKYVTHRDYHSRNIMLHNDDVFIIDFQDARMGIPQYDLVSLLEDCYYELDVKNKEMLKRYYWECMNGKLGKIVKYSDFEYYYDLMAIQRVFKAIGSFAYLYVERSDKRYLKYIGFGIEKLKTILFRHKEFNDLRRVLLSIYYDS